MIVHHELPHRWLCEALEDFCNGEPFHAERLGFAAAAVMGGEHVGVWIRAKPRQKLKMVWHVAGAPLLKGEAVCLVTRDTDIVDGNDPRGRFLRELVAMPIYGL